MKSASSGVVAWFVLSVVTGLAAVEAPREIISLDQAWRFHFGEVDNGQSPAIDDASWRRLDVPHDWSIEGQGLTEPERLPTLNVVEGAWKFHKGDRADWKEPACDDSAWDKVKLPAWWDDHSGYHASDAFGWYRRTITVPENCRGKPFYLGLGKIDDCDEAFLNGHKIGATGRMPPKYKTAWDRPRFYKVDPKWINTQGENVVAVRVYNGEAKGGMYDAGPSAAVGPEGPFDPQSPAGNGGGYLNGGIGWYRKTFVTAAAWKDRRVTIEFDGAYMDSDVWLNGTHLGRHPYGYTGFAYDLTPHLKAAGTNVLAVRLCVEQPCSRWYSGAGIFRHVRLVVTSPVHVAHWGTYVPTPKIAADAAVASVRTVIENSGSAAADVRLETVVRDPSGTVVGKDEVKGAVAAGGQTAFQPAISIAGPKLWSIETPELYTAVSKVYVGDRLVDSYATPFGIRTIAFTKDKGFFLNGKHVPLNGVCNHHDLGCLGAAVHRRAIQRQLEILKGMGCNAIRTSHNPPAPELLDLCDRMGFVVMDEAFDEWKSAKTPHGYGRFFDEWSERDLVSMLHRDRNHPCVILWSIGNEINEQGASNGGQMAQRLSDICHREDPTRPTTSACNNPGGADRTGYAKALDVFGINYNIGAYKGFRGKYAEVGSETSSALSTRGEYGLRLDQQGNVELRKTFDFQVTSYDLFAPGWGYTAEKDLLAMIASPWVAGEFVWTGFDYLGEPTPYGWPSRSSYFGIVDLAGFPKDRYYLYQSVWRSEPVVHLLPHWNWPGFEGKPIPVWCMTNCDTVELFLNDKSLGEKQLDRQKSLHVEWSVPYRPGTLRAVGKRGGAVVLRDEVTTAGAAVGLVLKPDRKKISADGDDLAFVEVQVVDKEGRVCPLADHLVRFKLAGEATIAGVDNGDPTNHEPFKADRHKVFHGLGLVVVQATQAPGTIKLRAESDGLEAADALIESTK